jgi:glycosyltransferase involved in cell wall biosynthesis
MRVLLVSELFLPRPYGGGVSRHVHDLARYLHEQGDEVHILASKSFPQRTDGTLPNGVEVIKRLNPLSDLSVSNRVKMFYDCLNLVNELDRIGNRYDVIHVHEGERFDFLYRRKVSTPVIATLHGIFAVCTGSEDLCNPGDGATCAVCYVKKHPALALGSPAIAIDYHYHYELTRRTLSRLHKIICVSDYVKRRISDYFGLPKSKMITIPNAVNSDDSQNIEKTESEQFRKKIACGHDKIILFVGRLVNVKGVQVLISSMPEILKSVDAELVIVGDGASRKMLERLAQQCNLNSHVLFTGSVDDKTLRLIYQIADVSVVPSLYETFGITAIEAFAARTPLVVANLGGLSEIVENGKTGVKVIPNDPGSLAKGVTEILSNPSFAESLKTNAYREFLNKYTWVAVGGKIRNLYKSLT